MIRALKTLRAVQWSLLASTVLCAALAEVFGRGRQTPDPSLTYLFAMLGVAFVGAIFVVRRTLVLGAAESLANHPDDLVSLSHWRTGYLATYVLCEALALLGLVLRLASGNLRQSMPYYFGGFVLLFFFRARQPVSP